MVDGALPRSGEADEPATSDPVQVVRSPEQVALHFPIAGPGSRILAYGIDYLVIAVLQTGLVLLLLLSTPLLGKFLELFQPLVEEVSSGKRVDFATSGAFLFAMAVFFVVQLVVELAYFCAWELLSGGRSLGKIAVGLRVIGDDGFPLTRQASLVRNLMRMVDMLPGSYLVGLLAIVLSPQCRRLGDLAAGTLVVRLDRPPAALPVADDAPTTHFRFSRAQVARLGATERALIRQTLRRLETLDAEQAARTLERTVEALRARIETETVLATEREDFLRALLRAVEAP